MDDVPKKQIGFLLQNVTKYQIESDILVNNTSTAEHVPSAKLYKVCNNSVEIVLHSKRYTDYSYLLKQVRTHGPTLCP